VKRGGEAEEQYQQLATALRSVGAGWVIEEVEDLTSRGKTVAFGRLAPDERVRYEERLGRETDKGLTVRRAKATEDIGVPYEDGERLELLAEAADRVIQTSVRAHAYVAEFARQHDLQAVVFEDPAGVDAAPSASERAVPFIQSADVEESLQAMSALLRRRVVD
jgi:hypothetical protein